VTKQGINYSNSHEERWMRFYEPFARFLFFELDEQWRLLCRAAVGGSRHQTSRPPTN